MKKLIRIIKAVLLRNSINLADVNSKIDFDTVNLHWWKLPGEAQNIGDYLSTIIVEYVKNILVTKNSRRGHLFAVGSIIDASYQNATVWGSGLLRGNKKYWWRLFRKLDVRAVRGPETRKTLIENGYRCPEIYGDPAILMPLIYKPKDIDKKYEYKVVAHMAYGTAYPNILSPYTNDWQKFIDELVKAKLIISSSLHGIILAETYGIPAILLNDHNMNLFKYKDYYYSTGRYDFPVAKSVNEALNMIPADIPDFEVMQQNLLKTFPVDLWEV